VDGVALLCGKLALRHPFRTLLLLHVIRQASISPSEVHNASRGFCNVAESRRGDCLVTSGAIGPETFRFPASERPSGSTKLASHSLLSFEAGSDLITPLVAAFARRRHA
jgi:hypothetical protein